MDIEALIPNLAGLLGVEPSTALLLFGLLVTGANLVGRVIPDDATGVLGTVRSVAKVVGLYLGNRVTKGVSVNDVAASAVGVAKPETMTEIDAALDRMNERVIPAFPDLPTRGPDGKFLPKDS